MFFLASDHTFKSMPRAVCSSHSQSLNVDPCKHQSKTLGYEADCELDGRDRHTEWFQYVLEDTSSKCVPMEEGYTQVTPAELAFMIKAELEVKAAPKPKKSKEPKTQPVTNHSTDYPPFYLEHTVKQVKLIERPAYAKGDLNHDPLEVDYSKHPSIQEVNLGTEEFPQKINIGAQLTPKMLEEYVALFKEFKDVIAWSYKDMTGIPPKLCQHRIYLEENTKPVCQRPYRLNPKYSLKVKQEIDKLLDAGFIYPIDNSEWVSPIVIVLKKNGEIRVCVDYRKLNAATKKDHFPLPFIDTMLDNVAGQQLYSFLDGFSGYNQVSIHPDDQSKTTFVTKWGTYAYRVMPFGLCNAPATFQRVVTQAF